MSKTANWLPLNSRARSPTNACSPSNACTCGTGLFVSCRRTPTTGQNAVGRRQAPLGPAQIGGGELRELGLSLMVYDKAVGSSARSAEVSGDRVLDVQRFGFPLRLLAASQSRLGRRHRAPP